jgi:capsule polysaccharide export protein KpsE/RkpR
LFSEASLMWNLRKAVISTQTMQVIIKARMIMILFVNYSLFLAMNFVSKPHLIVR